MRWRYAFDQVLEESMQEVLDNYGEEGWELVSSNRFERMEGPYSREVKVTRYALILKRPA